jgi:hypothetical protein
MNDNISNRPRHRLISVSSQPSRRTDAPVACHFCQEREPFVDVATTTSWIVAVGKMQSYFVICPACGAEGPKAATYDLALDRWAEIAGPSITH